VKKTLWGTRPRRGYLDDALAILSEWDQTGEQVTRVLLLNEAQHALLTERIKVIADCLCLSPDIRRASGETTIRISPCESEILTDREVTLAARIEDAYRSLHDVG